MGPITVDSFCGNAADPDAALMRPAAGPEAVSVRCTGLSEPAGRLLALPAVH